MQKILLIRPDRAGDAIKSLPALRALRQICADDLHILASHHNASCFEFEPNFTLHILPPSWEAGLTVIRNGFDKAILLPCEPTFTALQLLLSINSREMFAVVDKNRPFNQKITPLFLSDGTAAKQNECLNAALLISQALKQNIGNDICRFSQAPIMSKLDTEEAEKQMGTKQGLWLGVCPLAGDAKRTHPLKSWKKLVGRICQYKVWSKIFLLGPLSDRSVLLQFIADLPNADKVEICCPSSFRTLGAYLKRLDGLTAVDSGPLHLARALEVPSLGILSGADTSRWYPDQSIRDLLLPRGLFKRYPTTFEMLLAYRKWQDRLRILG
ncbi:MAG: glycosyltransferase family 9 protein [Deltaproteobacteria bacterium]|nr:glycosyltransferase family 9 protein [Deltaproteobacteria bacterium]